MSALVLFVSLGLFGGCGLETISGNDNPDHLQVLEQTSGSSATPALRVGQVLGGEADGFARASKVVPFVFPRDHGAHPDYRSEWWYLTCPLRATGGSEYGVQFTLFRQALTPPDPDKVAELPVSKWRTCLLYTSPSPRDLSTSRMPSSA